jgi:signal transduction histidine kinase
MRLSIKTKQVAGVTVIVGLAVVLLSGWFVASLAYVLLNESRVRAEGLTKTIYQRAFSVVTEGNDPALPRVDPVQRLQSDSGLQSILESGAAYFKNVLYASIVNPSGQILADSDVSRIGQTLEPADDLVKLIDTQGAVAQLRAIYTPGGKTFEVSYPLLLGTEDFGSIRIGISTLLIRADFEKELTTPLATTIAVLVGATFVAMLLAQIVLRPIHVIRSGLARLGRGELDVSVDLPQDTELGDLGASFRQVTARLAADRSELAGQKATLESVVDRLEDAVALFGPDGTLLFANPAMEAGFSGVTGTIDELLPPDHPYRRAVEATLAGDVTQSSQALDVPGAGERLILTHTVQDSDRRLLGVMLVARNLAYLSQVESTLSYSRKLAALGRLTAGIAHEIKNPLNATMIHLELLKIQLAETPGALEHVSVIAAQVRRLDEVVQGFLKFTRPEDLKLQPVYLAPLIEELMPIISAEASKSHVDVRLDVPPDLPPVQGDPSLLQQAFLNLALNACQAMPQGGRLRITARAMTGDQLEVEFEDSGVGISPEHLSKIFDLYFTTKQHGSGIGLSLVYRTVQLHDGDIEVQSIPGHGTTFRVQLRQATKILAPATAASAS